ncbi:hypothetical protein B0H11DRAFT_2254562 [Mycena galericulata]|nr:hypothetical protein B0H11DRAFT_2254562 [Mycena galericulata]
MSSTATRQPAPRWSLPRRRVIHLFVVLSADARPAMGTPTAPRLLGVSDVGSLSPLLCRRSSKHYSTPRYPSSRLRAPRIPLRNPIPSHTPGRPMQAKCCGVGKLHIGQRDVLIALSLALSFPGAVSQERGAFAVICDRIWHARRP